MRGPMTTPIATSPNGSPPVSGQPPLATAEISQRRAEAEKLLASGDFAGAEAAYQSILTLEPKNIYALMGLGNAARSAKELQLAERRYRDVVAIHPRNTWALFTLVNLMANQKRWDDGEAAATAAFAVNAGDFHTAMALGRLRRDRGDHQGALAAFEIAVGTDPNHVGASVEVGRSMIVLDRLDDAEICYRNGLVAAPRDQRSQLLQALASLSRKRSNRPATIDWLRQWVELAPNDQAASSELAAELVALAKEGGDSATVLSALEDALKLAPNNLQSTIDLAAAYRGAGRLDEAEAVYVRALAIKSNNLSAMLGVAGIARRRGQFEVALDRFRQTQAAHPTNSWVQIEVATSLRQLTRLDEAEALYLMIKPEDVHYSHVLSCLADIARERGDRPAAISFLKAVATASANPVPGLMSAAHEALQIRDFVKARAFAADIAARDPLAMQAPMLEGRICRAELNRDGARAAFLKAESLAPTEASPLVEVATECLALGETATADAYLERALALAPNNLQALLQHAERLRAQYDNVGALSLLERARAAHPTQPWPHINTAQLLAALGKTDDACRVLAEGRAACGPSAAFAAREGTLLQEAGYLDRAWTTFDDGHRSFPRDMWLWTSRALLAVVLGDFSGAQQALSNPPATTPADQARVLLVRAKLAEAQWQIEDASGHLASALIADPANAAAAHELAKLSLFRFDLTGARRYLGIHARLQSPMAHAAGRSPNVTQSQLGQIYDEFAIEPKLIGTLAALNTQGVWSRLTSLREVMRHNPASTAAALALTIALRRTGSFDQSEPMVEGVSAIPRVICQYWDAARPPDDIRAMMNSWGTIYLT